MGGGVGEGLSAQMQRDGATLPAQLAKQPTLAPRLLTFIDAFYDLDTERAHGISLVRIPWSKIVQYADHHGYDPDQLVFFVRRMDDAHLERLAKENGGGGSGGTQQTVQRPPRPDS